MTLWGLLLLLVLVYGVSDLGGPLGSESAAVEDNMTQAQPSAASELFPDAHMFARFHRASLVDFEVVNTIEDTEGIVVSFGLDGVQRDGTGYNFWRPNGPRG